MAGTVTSAGQDVLGALAEICGGDHVRTADARDVLDGRRPAVVAAPAGTGEVAAVLRVAADADLHVLVRGTGSKLRWGNPPRRADLLLDTSRMSAILEHVAGDLVVRVQAGTPLADVQRRVAEHGQRLALDPPQGGTVGGIVASGASGPLRHRFGTSRDLLIGSTVVLADGTVSRSGGKVVKNVAGYDLGKLFTGSCGTLGVLTELIFRLHPLPPVRRCLRLTVQTGQVAGAAVAALTGSQLVASALEISWDVSSGSGHLDVLFEGSRASVDGQWLLARSLWEHLGDVAEQNWSPAPPSSGDDVLVKICALPAELPRVLDCVRQASVEQRLSVQLTGQAGVGVTYLSGPGSTEPDRLLAAVAMLRTQLVPAAGTVVLLQTPLSMPQVDDRWGPVPALALMQRVKDRFDPDHRLAAGRFVGGM